ncbi:MAG: hypothetical protein L0332_06770 [Chloroflexi bacterium]|nr:hypothetical protein [Chloroflexota bacterium]
MSTPGTASRFERLTSEILATDRSSGNGQMGIFCLSVGGSMLTIISFLVQALTLITLLLLVIAYFGVIYILGHALLTAAQNRGVKWGSLVFLGSVLAAAPLLLRDYPQAILGSVRDSFRASIPIIEEIQSDVVSLIKGGVSTVEIPVGDINLTASAPPVLITPDATPATVPLATDAAPTLETSTTPLPPTSTIPPTATPVPTIDPFLWNPQTPPPTPEVRRP